MPKYYRVSPKYWKGDRRRWDDRKKLLALYLLTCEHRNLEGFYFLPKGYIQTDLGWPAKVVVDLLHELEDEEFIRYDEHAEVVFLIKSLAHQSPSTPNQITGAVAALMQVPSSSLWEEFRIACACHAPRLADAITGTWPVPEPSDTNGSSHAHVSAHRRHSSSSSSSSSSTPPRPPEGGRARDRSRYEEQLAAFAAEHFPGTPPGLVGHHATRLRSSRIEPTVEALRPLIEENAA